jgi:MFS family permease
VTTFRALRHREYRLFYFGQAVSVTGTWMQQIAQSWLMYRLTGSPLLLGMAGFASRAPVFFFSVPLGILTERLDRRRLLLVMQSLAAVQALALAILTLAGEATPFLVILFSLLLGIVNAVDLPARQALVGDLVPKEDMPSAVGLNSTLVNAARIIGPVGAGFLVAAAGEGYCFLINAFSFAAVLVSLKRMRPIENGARNETAGYVARLRQGMRYVLENREIGLALLMVAVVSFSGMPYVTLLPAIAAEQFGGDAAMVGWLMAASGLGAMLGAVLLAGRSSDAPLLRWVAAGAAIMSAGLFGLAVSPQAWVAFAALLAIGFGMITALSSANTFLQTRVPAALRGRVMSLYTRAVVGLAPFGGLAGGAAAEYMSLQVVIAACGAIVLFSAGYLTSVHFKATENGSREWE